MPLGSKRRPGSRRPTPSQLSATSQTPADARHRAVLFASAGQSSPTPSQLSARSQTPAEARHCAVLFASAGQSSPTPSQLSARSQTPAEARHCAVLFASAGQSSPTPSQLSARSQTPGRGAALRRALRIGRTVVADAVAALGQVADTRPTARHTAVLFASAGQSSLTPSQLSARSQTPAEARHSAVLLASAGQSSSMPSQVSARSQTPAEARQTRRALRIAPDRSGSCPCRSPAGRRHRPRGGRSRPRCALAGRRAARARRAVRPRLGRTARRPWLSTMPSPHSGGEEHGDEMAVADLRCGLGLPGYSQRTVEASCHSTRPIRTADFAGVAAARCRSR